MKEILWDENTYPRLKMDPTTRIEKAIAAEMKRLRCYRLIPDQLKDQLIPNYFNPGFSLGF